MFRWTEKSSADWSRYESAFTLCCVNGVKSMEYHPFSVTELPIFFQICSNASNKFHGELEEIKNQIGKEGKKDAGKFARCAEYSPTKSSMNKLHNVTYINLLMRFTYSNCNDVQDAQSLREKCFKSHLSQSERKFLSDGFFAKGNSFLSTFPHQRLCVQIVQNLS